MTFFLNILNAPQCRYLDLQPGLVIHAVASQQEVAQEEEVGFSH